MTLADAKKLGFLTETEEAEERERMDANWNLYHSLVKAGKNAEVKAAYDCVVAHETELEKQKMTVRYIEIGVRMRRNALVALAVVKSVSKKLDGKVYNKTFSQKITDELKKIGNFSLWDSANDYSHKIELLSYAKCDRYEVNITWQFNECLYVKDGQVKPRFCFEKFSGFVDSAESVIKREIERLENARDEKGIAELQDEITGTVKKLKSLQKKARDTYDETAVKNIYRWVDIDFFGR